jgi:hypothetical protein
VAPEITIFTITSVKGDGSGGAGALSAGCCPGAPGAMFSAVWRAMTVCLDCFTSTLVTHRPISGPVKMPGKAVKYMRAPFSSISKHEWQHGQAIWSGAPVECKTVKGEALHTGQCALLAHSSGSEK